MNQQQLLSPSEKAVSARGVARGPNIGGGLVVTTTPIPSTSCGSDLPKTISVEKITVATAFA